MHGAQERGRTWWLLSQERIAVNSIFEFDELASRVAREEQAAAEAKCERSRRAHLGLAHQYQRKLALVDAVQTSIRVSLG
jgi:hypothetical protein